MQVMVSQIQTKSNLHNSFDLLLLVEPPPNVNSKFICTTKRHMAAMHDNHVISRLIDETDNVVYAIVVIGARSLLITHYLPVNVINRIRERNAK